MEEVISYFRGAQKLLQDNDFESKDDFDLFMQNVFTEIDGKESRLACHHDGSMILEPFIGQATAFQIRVFFDRITGNMAKLTVHRYASHVVEALLARSTVLLAENLSEGDDAQEDLPSLPEMILRLSKEIGDAFEEVVKSPQGSHVYRSLLALMTDNCKQVKLFREELEVILDNVALSPVPFLRSLAFDANSSPVLQAQISTGFRIGSHSLEKILNSFFGLDDIAEATAFVMKCVNNEYAGHVVEASLKAMDAVAFGSFYRTILHSRLNELLQGNRSHHLVQHLISCCHNEGQLKGILADLQPSGFDLLQMQRAGVLVRLMQWCTAKKGLCESEIAAFLFEAFHTKSTSEKKSLVPLILRLQSFESLDLAKPVQALGCTLLAAIPSALSEATLKPFVDSLLDFSSQDLVNLSVNPQGSRAIEAFLTASSVSETANRRLVRKLTGYFAQLAVDKFGSHVVERCWAMSKVDLKNAIMEELLTAKAKLQDSQHGRMVWKNCKVEQFERRQADWVKEEAAAEKKKAYFADILGEDGGIVTAKTKKEKSKSRKKSKKNAEDDDSLLLTEDQPSSKKCKLLQ